MTKLEQLKDLCKYGFTLSINNHKVYRESVEECLEGEEWLDKESDTVKKMIELDTIIHMVVFPNNPVGSYSLFHYDLDKILDEALEVVKKD